MRKNCSIDQNNILEFEADGREFAKKNKKQLNNQFNRKLKGQMNFLNRMLL